MWTVFVHLCSGNKLYCTFFCRISVPIVNVAVQFQNDPLCWRASQLITGWFTSTSYCTSRLFMDWQSPFGLVHLWIRIQFSPPFPWNYPLLQREGKRMKCLENAFPVINFSKFSASGHSRKTGSTGRRSADFNPVLSGKYAQLPMPPQIDFTPYAYGVPLHHII